MTKTQYFKCSSTNLNQLFAQVDHFVENTDPAKELRATVTIEEVSRPTQDDIRFYFFAQTLAIAARRAGEDTFEVTYLARASDDNFDRSRARNILRGRLNNIHRPKCAERVFLIDEGAFNRIIRDLDEQVVNLFPARPEAQQSKHEYKNRRNRQFFPLKDDEPEVGEYLEKSRRELVRSFRRKIWHAQ